MKTSIIIIVALLLNTTLLIAEPLSTIVKDINPLVLLGIELVLLLGYVLNKWLKELHSACAIDLGYLNIFVLKSK
ncbi:hypothetical protein FGM00_16305 [Aggregatimonas sangjinii]|uniref:Uncharacterized protein n=1 Tax=Aggregatimonas sangjinii TaxID=2583587 RepID=A0A5B7SS53_9FLAO|nr:hypothetical protein [Aggregatimonas sangjinii]QCX01595.1 hypothetical protein FGM00_16305 [Aggregatimonas sangjinii]